MRRILTALAAAALLAGCGSTATHVTAPAATATTSAVTTPARTVAHVGDTLDLSFSAGKLAVTVVKVYDPATPANQFAAPEAGKRFVAVQVSIQNTSATATQGDPETDVRVIDSANQTYEFDLGGTSGGVAECQHLPSSSNLGPQEITAGCDVFALPTAAKVGKVQFTPQAGLSSTSGTWLVP